MTEILPYYELNNSYDEIKNNISDNTYTNYTKKIAEQIILTYENLEEHDKPIIEEGKINKLKIFIKNYEEETATQNEQPNKKYTLKLGSAKIDTLKETVTHLLAAKRRSEATELITTTIKQQTKIFTTRDDEKPEMWIYHEGIYIPNGRARIKEAIRKILGELHTTHITNEIINKIEADTYIDQEKFFEQQNKYPELIATQNGILNIKTQTLEPFNNKYYFFNKINAEYIPGKDCKNIKQFLKEILPDEKSYDTIQELIGFCLLKEYKYEKSFMFIGEGSNGKTKLLDLIKKFLGAENCLNLTLSKIEKDNFAVSEIHNKLVNISGEITKEALDNTGTFKELTGRGTITAGRKFKTGVSFESYAKMIFATNDLPRTKDMTDGFWRRWVLMKFPYKFLPQKEINLIPEKERTNIKLQNPEIIKSISTKEELNGLLNFALKGFERLEKQKDFTDSKSTNKTAEMWIRTSDSFSAFLMDHITEEYDAMIQKQVLKEMYHRYCKRNKLKLQSDMAIKYNLTKNLAVTEARPLVDGVQYGVWVGIKFSKGSKGSKGFSVCLGI